MTKILSWPLIVQYAFVGALVLALASLLFNLAGALILLIIFFVIYKICHQPKIKDMLVRLLVFLQNHVTVILLFQGVLYGLAYNSLLPNGMYFSPDSVNYLRGTNIVPPNFSLLAQGLIKLELALGGANFVLLRYLAIILYTGGGWLLAKALLRSKHPMVAILVLPALWSMSSLTQWFNYFLTDGLATTFMVICIGAYANMYVSMHVGAAQSRDAWGWLALFVFFGMLAFAARPAFVFMAPVMVFLMFNRPIFRWRRVFAVSLGVVILVIMHFSFAYYWHGRAPTQLGGALTALVFDLPIPHTCELQDDSNLCRTQRALEPFIKASRDLGATREQYVYKLLNNGPVVEAARAAVKNGDPNYSVLLEIALLKIGANPWDYAWMVLRNSYYSVQSWGDWAWNDNLGRGSVAMVNIDNTNAVAPLISVAMWEVFGVHFDPFTAEAPREHFYKNILFQFPRLIVSHQLVFRLTPVLFVLVIVFVLAPIFVRGPVMLSILFACCALSIGGTIVQSAFFPVAPRLLDPFHPLAAVGVLMFASLILDARRVAKASFRFS